MPSDARIQLALGAVSGCALAFRSAVAAAAEQAGVYLAAHTAGSNGRTARLAAELGPFGLNRIDVERLSSVFPGDETLDPRGAQALERARQTLAEIAASGEEFFLAEVPAGESLAAAVGKALAGVGRAFGAARLIELCRAGGDTACGDAGFLAAFPFKHWSKAQRRLAPPLVVSVRGSDLRAAGLAEFLDGNLKLVLVVRGESPPAPLVRLIAPGTVVVQTSGEAGLDRLAAWNGPGIAALVPEGAAQFTHDPAAGAYPWERLTVTAAPDEKLLKPLGGLSASQQAEEVHHLQTLAQRPTAAAAPERAELVPAAAPVSSPPAADPVEKLAAWLLDQAGLA